MGHKHWVTCIELDESSLVMYSAGLDKALLAWDFHTGKLLHEYEGHQDWIVALKILDTAILTASEDGTVRSWQKYSGDVNLSLSTVWNAHASAVKAMLITGPDKFITGGNDGAIKGWQLERVHFSLIETSC